MNEYVTKCGDIIYWTTRNDGVSRWDLLDEKGQVMKTGKCMDGKLYED